MSTWSSEYKMYTVCLAESQLVLRESERCVQVPTFTAIRFSNTSTPELLSLGPFILNSCFHPNSRQVWSLFCQYNFAFSLTSQCPSPGEYIKSRGSFGSWMLLRNEKGWASRSLKTQKSFKSMVLSLRSRPLTKVCVRTLCSRGSRVSFPVNEFPLLTGIH